jgi:ATP-dependent RNA helicase DeaD
MSRNEGLRKGRDTFHDGAMTFLELGISDVLARALAGMGILSPTSIQEKAIPPSLAGENVFAESETGTGKTLAFLLPLLQSIDPGQRGCRAFIISPTRELSSQSSRVLDRLVKASASALGSALVIGGASPLRQVRDLAARPQIILGTPGRILALAEEGSLDARRVSTVILDEADRLFSPEMREETEALLALVPAGAALRIFSATLPAATIEAAKRYATAAVVIREEGSSVLSGDIEHACLLSERRKKLDLLVRLDKALKPARAILFARDSGAVLNALARLDAEGIPARALHGDFDSAQRLKALDDFRRGDVRWLVASDVAARGLDIEGATQVVMLDAPRDALSYVHRAGRTGRIGSSGSSIVIADGRELRFLSRIASGLGISFKTKRLYSGELVETSLEEFFGEADRLNAWRPSKKRPRAGA